MPTCSILTTSPFQLLQATILISSWFSSI